MDTNKVHPPADFPEIDNAFWRSLLENVTDAVIVIDKDQRIVYFNPGGEAMFSYVKLEVIDEPLNMLIPNRFGSDHVDHVERFLASPETTRFMGLRQEISGLRKDGIEFPAEATITKVYFEGTVYYAAILRDLTKRKKADREREELISELERFAQTVSHELKAPLSIISGYSALVMDSFREYSDEELLEMLKSIENNAIKMAQKSIDCFY